MKDDPNRKVGVYDQGSTGATTPARSSNMPWIIGGVVVLLIILAILLF